MLYYVRKPSSDWRWSDLLLYSCLLDWHEICEVADCTVCPGISVRKLGIITVVKDSKSNAIVISLLWVRV